MTDFRNNNEYDHPGPPPVARVHFIIFAAIIAVGLLALAAM